MSEEFTNIVCEQSGYTVKLMINRPPLNILDIATLAEIKLALDEFEKREDIHFILFTGAGEDAFSVGHEVKDRTPDRIGPMLNLFYDMIFTLVRTEKITISVVKGCCFGAGMELAMVCDFLIASEGAKFSQPEINLGCFPPVATAYLARLIGVRRAAEMVMTAKQMSAGEAENIGLVTRVVPDGELAAALDSLIGELSSKSPAVLKLTKQALRYGSAPDFVTALKATERIYFDRLMATEDAIEGIEAFLQERTPTWKGK